MNDQEKARIIAEMMGWWLYDAGDYPLDCWINSSDEVVCDRQDYDPTNNVAQAIEAANYWYEQNSDKNCGWSLSTVPGGKRYCIVEADGDMGYDYWEATADTEAAAIVDALLAAMEGS